MSVEARALLDALMGPDRDAPLPPGTATARRDQWNASQRRGNRKSCFDKDICPYYCAWGVDVYELFTNTKSDLGTNPNVVQEDAREEYLSLPEHEKNRLGYELMLYRKLTDLVRNCDRVVSRNKDKLRAEISKNAKARGAGPMVHSIDPVTAITDEMLNEAAECIAEIEIREEQVESLVMQLATLETNEKDLYFQLMELRKALSEKNETNVEGSATPGGDKNVEDKTDADKDLPSEASPHDTTPIQIKMESTVTSEETAELETKLYSLFSKKQEILSSIATVTCSKLVPLRETLQNLQKQLHYVRSDTASDKSVCEISGNFMSSRDADERIAAHYAGKQYVGWKLVREKLKELQKKYPGGYGQLNHNISAPMSRSGPWPNPSAGYEQFQRGPPPDFQRGPPPDTGSYRDRPRGPPYTSPPPSNHGRMPGIRRGPSPDRWERDRNGDERRSYGYNRSNR